MKKHLENKISKNPDVEISETTVDKLKKLQPGLGMMYYKSALCHSKSIEEAAEFLRVKRFLYI